MTRSHFWAGVGLVVLAALLLSSSSISAVLSYDAAGNPGAVIVTRFFGAVIVLYLILRVSGVKMGLSPATRYRALLVGIPQATQSICLYNALDSISVGLTMIIFYVYPLLVGVLASAIGQDRVTRSLAMGLGIAFIGLVLVFDVGAEGFDMNGALYSAGAAVSWALVVVFTSRLARGEDPRRITLHVQLSALLIALLAIPAGLEVHFPETGGGWGALVLVPLFYGCAMAVFFIAVNMIGPVRAALVMNVEAVIAALLAYVILAQTLTPMQLAGGALVILAVFASQRERGVAALKTEN